MLNVRKFRHFYMSLKVGSLSLEIQRGQLNNIPNNERLRKLCGTDVEDKYNLVLKCPNMETFKDNYIYQENMQMIIIIIMCILKLKAK